MKPMLAVLFLAMAAACSPPAQEETPIPVEGGPHAAQAPADVLAVIAAQDAGFTANEAVEDASTGAQTYRVSGASGGGDVTYQLMRFNEGWRIVSIRRDIDWGDAPVAVRDAVAASPAAIVPIRTVEVREPGADGVIYELWSGEPEMLAISVRDVGGEAAIMPPEH